MRNSYKVVIDGTPTFFDKIGYAEEFIFDALFIRNISRIEYWCEDELWEVYENGKLTYNISVQRVYSQDSWL